MSISVIMPCYNAATYIHEAITSVLAQGDWVSELIVIDDASTDGSADLVLQLAHPKIRLLRRAENGGIALARNQGIAASSGVYLAFLDADDWWPEDRLAKMQASLGNGQWCFGQIEHFYSPELQPMPSKPLPPIQTGYFASAMLVRHSFFDSVGPFNPQLRVGEFIDWFDRARAISPDPVVLHEVVLRRRIHRSNSSLTSQQHVNDYLKVAALAIARKRST
jgi:glycosyltransferase involved in cell wall biosynthesis